MQYKRKEVTFAAFKIAKYILSGSDLFVSPASDSINGCMTSNESSRNASATGSTGTFGKMYIRTGHYLFAALLFAGGTLLWNLLFVTKTN